jgi:hypothetical protein
LVLARVVVRAVLKANCWVVHWEKWRVCYWAVTSAATWAVAWECQSAASWVELRADKSAN